MEFTKEQLEIIQAEDPKVVHELSGNEVMALFPLGQLMHGKVVRLVSAAGTKVGVFSFEELNNESDLDFEDPSKWEKVECNQILLTLNSPNAFGGHDNISFENAAITRIKSIASLSL